VRAGARSSRGSRSRASRPHLQARCCGGRGEPSWTTGRGGGSEPCCSE
jgi:hypothetical protein